MEHILSTLEHGQLQLMVFMKFCLTVPKAGTAVLDTRLSMGIPAARTLERLMDQAELGLRRNITLKPEQLYIISPEKMERKAMAIQAQKRETVPAAVLVDQKTETPALMVPMDPNLTILVKPAAAAAAAAAVRHTSRLEVPAARHLFPQKAVQAVMVVVEQTIQTVFGVHQKVEQVATVVQAAALTATKEVPVLVGNIIQVTLHLRQAALVGFRSNWLNTHRAETATANWKRTLLIS